MRAIAASLGAIAAVAAYLGLLGWLKTVYFLKPFGLSPAQTDPALVTWLASSWYVAQNLAYFTAILWITVQSRRFAVALLALVYALLPLATHYAFLGYDLPAVRWWVDHQHTWLKGIPLVLLAILLVSRLRGHGVALRWRHGAAGWVILALVAGSWGLSAAKHLGSYDAERILHRQGLLPRVEVAAEWDPEWTSEPLYLLHRDATRIVFLHLDRSAPWTRARVVAYVIPTRKIPPYRVLPATGVQPGGQYL